ncbi:1661_t:CDS:2 [Paraglomus brasilianum]|uniref:1661_t:CDS:1 n=1 Tax=Paraglomus brasilianum TaxID=144538 RepID=A0A9N8ZCC7_9GLOM|nr:1661_t:CDS:2 [Paraglomus brasilianum]
MAIPKVKHFEITLTDKGVAIIAFNRPARKNALNGEVYKEWDRSLIWAAQSSEVKVAIMTGKGKFYTSGHELAPTPDADESKLEKTVKESIVCVQSLLNTLINFPKLLIAAVNGPAIGFGMTTLALCDVVYAVPDAIFFTPFMQFGFCAEGCSSYLFPNRIIQPDNFIDDVVAIATKTTNFPPTAIFQTKDLIRARERETLMAVSRSECELLQER